MSSENLPRNQWSRTPLPAELVDLLRRIAVRDGFAQEDIHLLIYSLLKKTHAEDLERLSPYYETDWMDTD